MERAEDMRSREVHKYGVANFSGMRVSDTGHLKRMGQAGDLPVAEEAVVQHQKKLAEEAFLKVSKDKRIQQQKHSNLTHEEQERRKEVILGIQEKGWHVSVTDKTQMIVLDTVVNYRRGLERHSIGDPVVSLEDITAKEIRLYDYIAALARIFSMGRDEHQEQDKIIQALKLVFCGVAALNGEAKDHKEGWEVSTGPPKRPLVNGNINANVNMGLLTSMLLRPVRTDVNNWQGTSICSREELLCDVTYHKRRLTELARSHVPERTCTKAGLQDFSKVIVGLIDICSLYPNCKLVGCKRLIKETVELGHTKFEGLDKQFMLKFLGIEGARTGTSADRLIPQPKGTTTLNSLTTNEHQGQF